MNEMKKALLVTLTWFIFPIVCDHFIPSPGCGNDVNATFCESQDWNYPDRQYLANILTNLEEEEKVVLMVNSRRYQTVGLSGSEKFQYADVASDGNASDGMQEGSPVCSSMKSFVSPRKAKSAADNKWR